MKRNSQRIRRIIVLTIILCFPFLAQAQTDPGDCPTCVPIDGGLSLLLAAGVGYGIKKVRDGRRERKK